MSATMKDKFTLHKRTFPKKLLLLYSPINMVEIWFQKLFKIWHKNTHALLLEIVTSYPQRQK